MQLKIFWHYGGCLNKRAASSTTTKSTAEAVLFVVVEMFLPNPNLIPR